MRNRGRPRTQLRRLEPARAIQGLTRADAATTGFARRTHARAKRVRRARRARVHAERRAGACRQRARMRHTRRGGHGEQDGGQRPGLNRVSG
eukprot:6184339-Pleurochrysis_carterae.AAC.6